MVHLLKYAFQVSYLVGARGCPPKNFLAPTRSSRKANVRSFVRPFGSSLSRAINLLHFGSNFQADFKGLS